MRYMDLRKKRFSVRWPRHRTSVSNRSLATLAMLLKDTSWHLAMWIFRVRFQHLGEHVYIYSMYVQYVQYTYTYTYITNKHLNGDFNPLEQYLSLWSNVIQAHSPLIGVTHKNTSRNHLIHQTLITPCQKDSSIKRPFPGCDQHFLCQRRTNRAKWYSKQLGVLCRLMLW